MTTEVGDGRMGYQGWQNGYQGWQGPGVGVLSGGTHSHGGRGAYLVNRG